MTEPQVMAVLTVVAFTLISFALGYSSGDMQSKSRYLYKTRQAELAHEREMRMFQTVD